MELGTKTCSVNTSQGHCFYICNHNASYIFPLSFVFCLFDSKRLLHFFITYYEVILIGSEISPQLFIGNKMKPNW